MESGLFSLYGLELLESQNMFSMFGIEIIESFPVSGEAHFPCYINGSIGEACITGIPLYTSGETGSSSGNMTLYTCGSLSSATGIPLYTMGIGSSTGVRPLYIQGYDTQQTGIPLYMYGSVSVQSGIPLYMYGYDTKTSGIPLYMVGSIANSGANTLYTQGAGTANSNFNLYIGDLGERIENSFPLFLQNPGGFSGMPLSIWGIGYGTNVDQTLNGYVDHNAMLLFIDGGGTQGSMPLYMPGPTGALNEGMDLYMPSSVPGTGTNTLFIDAYDYDTQPIKLYTHGF